MPKQKGFTLIELLLVIVILSILAGVVISVLNPRQMILRAKDAIVISTIIKVGFAVEAFAAANGRIPSNTGCTCQNQEKCELLHELQRGNIECHKTQIVSEGTKLWMEVEGVKMGKTLLGSEIDLDDSDAIRYHDWDNGCVAGVSEAYPPWVFVWHRNYGLLSCHPGTEIHPGLFTCNHLHNTTWRKLNCDVM